MAARRFRTGYWLFSAETASRSGEDREGDVLAHGGRSVLSRLAKGLVVGLVAAGLTFSASTAVAGEAESETFFAKGRELRAEGNCQKAIEEFRKALSAWPEGLGSQRNIAECEESLGRPASARRSWWALRTMVLGSQSDKYIGWEKDAEAAHKRLEPLVALLNVRVKNAAEPRVLINGRPLTPTLLGTDIEQDLGEIEIVLEDGGAVPVVKKIKLESGQRYDVELESLGPVRKPDDKVPPTGKPIPKDTGPSPFVITGGVALGLAGLAAGGLIGAVVVRQNALSKIEDDCGEQLDNCSPDLQDEEDKGKTASTLVNAFAIGGGIAAAAGVGFLIAGLVTGSTEDEAPAKADVKVTIAPHPQGGFIGLSGTF